MKKPLLSILLICSSQVYADTASEIKLSKITAECVGTFSLLYFKFENTQPPDPEFLKTLQVYSNKARAISEYYAEKNHLGASYTQDTMLYFVRSVSPLIKSDPQVFSEFLKSSGQGCKQVVDQVFKQ